MFAAKLTTVVMLASVSLTVAAGPTIPGPKWQPDDETAEAEVAYVDSVTGWGAWELDIEPAAGGVTPSSPRAMNPRSSKVALRTNSIAELGPPPTSSTPPSTPTPPAGPPTIRPISPSVPIPVGGPGDGF